MTGMADWAERLLTVDLSHIDYPGTTYWSPASNFLVPQTPRSIRYVIIHITGGPHVTFQGVLTTFRAGPASAHYVVDREGRVLQMVREQNIANHVDNIHSQTNRESIGIEHVNPWDPNPRMYPTESQYRASARLVAWLCRQYSIPAVHSATPHAAGVRGHIEEAPHSEHRGCPNPAWDWTRYVSLVQGQRAETFDDIIRSLARR